MCIRSAHSAAISGSGRPRSKSSDPFGLYQIEWHDPASVPLTVTPPTVPLPGIAIAPGGQQGDGGCFLQS